MAPSDSIVGRYPKRPNNARFFTTAKLRDITSRPARRRSASNNAITPPTSAIAKNAPIRRLGPMNPPTAASNLTSPPPNIPSANGTSARPSPTAAPSTPSNTLSPKSPRNTSAAPRPAAVNRFGIRRDRTSNQTLRLSSVVSAALAIIAVLRPTIRPERSEAGKDGPPLLEDRRYCGVYAPEGAFWSRSEEHTSELQSLRHLVCRLLLEK